MKVSVRVLVHYSNKEVPIVPVAC